MPAPEKFYEQLKERLRGETDRKVQDKLLDLWLATTQMATEWDAKEWGFDPDQWMREERDILARRVNEQGKEARKVRRGNPE